MVEEYLKALKVDYKIYNHPAVYTVEEAKKYTHHIKGVHCKNLFLRNRKGNQHYLLVLEEDRQVDLKSFSKAIGSSNLSFASEERLFKYLKLKPGSVGPFGLLNDEERHVKVFLDQQLFEEEYAAFHPNKNTQTLCLKTEDLRKILMNLGYQIEMI